MRAAVLVTGDEVLGGRVPERNAAFLARSLAEWGIPVVRTVVVGDALVDVEAAVAALVALDVELVCTTGGLGPTFDDLTMQAVAHATGRELALNADALTMVRNRSRNIPRRYGVDDEALEAMRRKQATLPVGATVLPPSGTAPGALLEHDNTMIVVLPGPPWELQQMWTAAVASGPLADQLARGAGELSQTFRIWALLEAELVVALDVLPTDELAQIGTYTRDGELEVVAPAALAPRVEEIIRAAFGDAVYADDGQTVDLAIADLLRRRGETLAVAESCTGGGVGARLTAMSGASDWFLGGVIAYANDIKERLLGVPTDVLARDGAVSRASAEAMAGGVREVTGATWGVAITGVAGPGGGTPDKPVGLVWIAIAGPDGVEAIEGRFRGDRGSVRRRAETSALHHLRVALTSP